MLIQLNRVEAPRFLHGNASRRNLVACVSTHRHLYLALLSVDANQVRVSHHHRARRSYS
jgi:hypothetical protein